MGLCTRDNLKARMGLTGDGDNTLLDGMIAGVSARMARACGRIAPDGTPCLEKTSLTEVLGVPDRDMTMLYLRARPVVSITTIKEGLYNDFTDSDELTAGDDYHADLNRGRLHRIGCSWRFGPQTVEVVYVGGYVAAGVTPGDGEQALPDDLVDAAMQQCQYLYQRRSELGATGTSVEGGSVSWAGQYTLLKDVREVCRSCQRRIL